MTLHRHDQHEEWLIGASAVCVCRALGAWRLYGTDAVAAVWLSDAGLQPAAFARRRDAVSAVIAQSAAVPLPATAAPAALKFLAPGHRRSRCGRFEVRRSAGAWLLFDNAGSHRHGIGSYPVGSYPTARCAARDAARLQARANGQV